MTCGSCGTANPSGADVCGTCGAFLGSALPTSVSVPTASSPWQGGAVETEQTNPNLPIGAKNGSRVAGRYELLSILGTGGTGVVYRARDTELGEEIAIKILPPVKEGESDVARLKREIIAARRITHPNVIRLHEFGLNDKEGFLSMEILPGGSLADRLNAGPLSIAEALRIVIGVCDGLAAAHAVGIIHRDVKPQNVLFDKAGNPKIVDFGLARGTEISTNTVGFSGTPQYMSPESADGGEITVKSDIYSLGVMMFEVFTGRRPFLAPSLGRLVVMHTKEAPPAPRSFRPDLPAEVEEVILRALEKDPARRTDGAADIAAVLRRLQATIAPLDAAADERARAKAPRVTTEPPPLTLVRGTLPLPRRRALWLAAPAGLVAVLLAAWAAGPWRTSEPVPGVTPIPLAAATASVAATPLASAVATGPAPAIAAATAAPPPTAKPASTSRPRATPVPAPTRAAGATTAAKKPGSLLVKSSGTWVKVVVGDTVVDHSTPMPAPHPLPAGRHKVRLTNPATSFSREVTIDVKPGALTTIVVDPVAGTHTVE